ncbi:MAG: glycosyltransferase family 4 protein [Acidimicrobiia bacterium]
MIRLLSIQPVAERGGSDQALLRLVRSLPPADFDCHVAVPAPHPLAAEFAAAGATLHVVPMRRISTSNRARDWVGYAAGWPLTVRRLRRLGRELAVDLVHSNSLHSWYGWAAARRLEVPHVWHAREIVVQSGAARRLERSLTRRYATRVFAVSNAVAAQLDPANVVVVRDDPDPADFAPMRAGRFRGRVGVGPTTPLVGAAGRIDTWKGIGVLLDAFPRVRAAVTDAELAVAGAPVRGKEQYAADLARRAAATPGVHWLGPRDDVPDLLADLDVLVLPSTEPEPYGLILVEALASGTPVVATDQGGPREIVARAAPGAGDLVPRGDADALAGAIIEHLRRATDEGDRANRPRLLEPEPPRYAELLRDAVDRGSARPPSSRW